MTQLDYLNQTYPIRRTKEEKKNFQNYVLETSKAAKIETTKDGKNENIGIGNPETAPVALILGLQESLNPEQIKDVVADNKNIAFLKKQMERFFCSLTKSKLYALYDNKRVK